VSQPLTGFVLRQAVGVAASVGLDVFVCRGRSPSGFRADHHRHREGAAERPSALIWVGLLIGPLHASLSVANVVTAGLWISGRLRSADRRYR